jgi:fluoride exporter
MSLLSCIMVILGGALGTFARYALSVATLPISRSFPWGTVGINVTGSFLIAFIGTLTLAHGRFAWSENARLFVMVGFCGGYTTSSSFSLQSFDLVRTGGLGRAALNVALCVALCIGAVAVGHLIAARLNGGTVQIVQIGIEEEG